MDDYSSGFVLMNRERWCCRITHVHHAVCIVIHIDWLYTLYVCTMFTHNVHVPCFTHCSMVSLVYSAEFFFSFFLFTLVKEDQSSVLKVLPFRH